MYANMHTYVCMLTPTHVRRALCLPGAGHQTGSGGHDDSRPEWCVSALVRELISALSLQAILVTNKQNVLICRWSVQSCGIRIQNISNA